MRVAIADVAAAIGAGARAAWRHPGLVAVTYAIQLAVSLVPATVLFAVLAARYGGEPHLDRAMSGELSALILIARDAADLLSAAGVLVALSAAAYAAISWFLVAGLIAVFAEPPASRAESARRFGAGGARHTLAFARLFGWSLIPYTAVAVLAAMGLEGLEEAARHAMSGGELARAAALELGPAALALWLVWTAIDYARIELCTGERLVSRRALVRGFRRVLTRPACLLHNLVGYLAAALVALIAFELIGWIGAAGVLLLALRQLALVARHVIHVGVLAGQVEIAGRIDRRGRSGSTRA